MTVPREWAMIETFPLKRGSSNASLFVSKFIWIVIVSRIRGRNRGLRYARQSGTV